jgi:uncharacterized flavoprotein (TIGR03862 family)
MKKKIAILGSGPSSLMAADHLANSGAEVHIFERRKSAGWKLLVAGSSGLNVSFGEEEEKLFEKYRSRNSEMKACLDFYPRSKWLNFLEELGEVPFLGSSKRYLIENKKAAELLQNWVTRLKNLGVLFHFEEEFQDLDPIKKVLNFASGRKEAADAILFCLGSPSWEKAPSPWPEAFQRLKISFTPFESANAGYAFQASKEFFLRAEGKPIKGFTLTTRKGQKTGECMITRYGLEGTPIYSVGCEGEATLDLKPDLSLEKLSQRLKSGKLADAWRLAKLSPGAELLAQEFFTPTTPEDMAQKLKNLKIQLLAPQPLTESISASGGISWDELSINLELKKYPGIFCAGEMVDWDAPTGGFLIQGCVSMGAKAAAGISAYLKYSLATV